MSFLFIGKDTKKEPFLIYPHEGKFNLLTSDNKGFPVVSTGKEEFIHINKFIAVFRTKEDAITGAQRAAINAVG